MARRDLNIYEVEQMAREEPGSAARYLEERRAELEAEKQAKREADDERRWIEAFVAGGGNRADGKVAYKAHRNEQAAAAAWAADEATELAHRRHINGQL